MSGVWRWRASLLLMMASGFAGLGYQIVWTQQSALWLGHESAAVLAVVAAFFGGLAVGAFALGSRIEKSASPGRWYAACEFVIAAWSLVLALGLSPFSAWVVAITGAEPSPAWQWVVAFGSTFALLLPATAAMGATLPAMERVTARLGEEGGAVGRSVAPLYASNTFGAVVGVLAIAFWLAPELGLVRTAAVCVVLNMLCGVAALALFNRTSNPLVRQVGLDGRAVLIRLAMTGLLGIGYEVLVVRVLSQVAENTVYTFAMLLAVYLAGSAIGAAAYQRWLGTRLDAARTQDRLLHALAAACLLGTASLWGAEHLKEWALQQSGPGVAAAIGAEAVLALVAFGLPTIAMGAVFSHLSARAIAAGVGFGRALAVNTLGAAAAPVVFGVLAFPLLGPKVALLLISAGYLVLTSWRTPETWRVWRARRAPAASALAPAVVALAVLAPPLAFIDVPEGGRIVSYREGVMAAVSVVEDADGVARLRINNRQQEGSNATLRVDARQALLPVLLHPSPSRALFLGLGTGVTATSAASMPGLQVDAVELLPEVIAASPYFTSALTNGPTNPQLHVIAADARRYVRASNHQYDVIVSDNFHPARSGSGSLYTVEHFEAIRARLEADGLFCQWLPLHQMDLDTLRSIVQSFRTVYPNAWAMLASNSLETPVLGLVARADGGRFDVSALREHLHRVELPQPLSDIGIEDELALLGSFVSGPESLNRFAAGAPPNTDDHPIVAYRAPRITYAPDSLPRDRLFALLAELSIDPNDLIAPTDDVHWPTRLAAYWLARDRFIESGRSVRPSANVRDMLAQVRDPLLSVLHISPDFRPAYDPLVRMATALAQTDSGDARALLTELARIQPARPEAQLALHRLAATPPYH